MAEDYRSRSQEYVYNTSEIAWQRVFETTGEQGEERDKNIARKRHF